MYGCAQVVHRGGSDVWLHAGGAHWLLQCNFRSVWIQLSTNLQFTLLFSNELNFGFIWKISISVILIDKDFILVRTRLADVHGCKWYMRSAVFLPSESVHILLATRLETVWIWRWSCVSVKRSTQNSPRLKANIAGSISNLQRNTRLTSRCQPVDSLLAIIDKQVWMECEYESKNGIL